MATYTTYSARYHLTRAFQILIILVVKVLSRFSTRTNFNELSTGLADQPYLIVANHRRAFDPFIICANLPLRYSAKFLPIGFMSHNVFYDSPLRPLMWLAGCFPARNPRGKHTLFGVDGAVQMLQKQFSMFIFPEGTRVYHKPRGEAHSGVIRIHKALPQIPMILCHIEYNKGLGAWLAGNRRVVTYKLVKNPEYDDPEKLMDDVFAL
jgi:1-acyl-sn-glycerol-3-phosphate acyltransferase